MEGQDEATARRKRVAEDAAKVVLAKHPCVVAGSGSAVRGPVEPTAATPSDVRLLNIGWMVRR